LVVAYFLGHPVYYVKMAESEKLATHAQNCACTTKKANNSWIGLPNNIRT